MTRWAMIGRSPGNGHPYSWSAICNGFNPVEMHRLTEFPGIPRYLDAAPRGEFGVGDARVTHIWMPDRAEAEFCARCSLIPYVVDHPEEVIGKVDAVVIPTDDGRTHLEAGKPFLDAGLPVLVDKPLCLTLPDLRAFEALRKNGARLMSCSSARYCREFMAAARDQELGLIRVAHVTVPHAWETYGIHGVEGLIHMFGVAAVSLSTTGRRDCSVTTIGYADGRIATVSCVEGGFPGLWIEINGSKSNAQVAWKEYFLSFRDTLRTFHAYVVSGQDPFPFAETVSLMEIIAAGIDSRERGGALIDMKSFRDRGERFSGQRLNGKDRA